MALSHVETVLNRVKKWKAFFEIPVLSKKRKSRGKLSFGEQSETPSQKGSPRPAEGKGEEEGAKEDRTVLAFEKDEGEVRRKTMAPTGPAGKQKGDRKRVNPGAKSLRRKGHYTIYWPDGRLANKEPQVQRA